MTTRTIISTTYPSRTDIVDEPLEVTLTFVRDTVQTREAAERGEAPQYNVVTIRPMMPPHLSYGEQVLLAMEATMRAVRDMDRQCPCADRLRDVAIRRV